MAGGSNVETVSATVNGSIVDILYAISTSGRQEDGYAIIMDSSYQEVLRSDYFRVYGNSSTSKSVNISSLPDGNYYAGFWSDEWGGMSPSMQPFTKGNPPLTNRTTLYGSVNNSRKMVRKLYGEVNGTAKEIVKLYGSVNGKAVLIYPGMPFGYITFATDATGLNRKTVEAWTMNEITALHGTTAGWTATIDGETIAANRITDVVLTKRVKNISTSYWLAYTDMLEKVDMSETSITKLDKNWFYYGGGEAVNVPNPAPSQFTEVKLPDTVTTVDDDVFFRSKYNGPLNLKNVTTIGNYFLREARRFNGQITTSSSSPITIGQQFMYWCMDYNKPLTLPAGSTFGDYFMASCFSFNSALGLSGNVSAGNHFMNTCSSFNQNLNCTFTNIGSHFLNQCHNFNKPLTITSQSVGDNFLSYNLKFNQQINLSSLEYIGAKFMERCEVFNYPITIGGHGRTIPDDFMFSCVAFNSNINLGATSSVGNNFMSGCTAFDATLTADYLNTVGDNFMASCSAWTGGGFRVPQFIGDYFCFNCSSLNVNPSFRAPNSAYAKTIGNYFMNNCGSSIGTVWLDETIITSVGTHFMFNTSVWYYNMGNLQPTNFADSTYSFSSDQSGTVSRLSNNTTALLNSWKTKFPNRTTTPFRNIVDFDF